MENKTSPLQKYKRQPKLYIDLPSKGVWFPKNQIDKSEELEVYSMSANDEIGLKTPDALYSGLAVKRLIESCIPSIKDAWFVPLRDLDYILAAIRLASYGETIELTNICPKCETKDTYGLQVQVMLEHLEKANPIYEVVINNFKFKLRPLTYKEITAFQQEVFQVRRTVQQLLSQAEDGEEKSDQTQKLYDKLKDKTLSTIAASVIEIVTPDGESETTPAFISDFIINGDKDYYNGLQDLFEDNQKKLRLPDTEVECSSCGNKTNVNPDLDYSNFFVRG
jgi:hypothetical protein